MDTKKINTSRRSFIKYGSAGIAGMTGLGSAVLALPAGAAAAGEVKGIITAAHWGPLALAVQDGKVVKSAPAYPGDIANPLQTVTPDLIYSESRIKSPMVRKSFLENPGKSDTTLRGRDEWVKVSWEQALDLVAGELKRVRDKQGSEGIFAGSYGWQSTGNLHVSRTLLHRFMNMSGGFVGHKGDYSTGAAQIIMPHVMGSIEVYEQQTSWPLILEHSDTVVLWGANPMVTLQIAWSSTDEQGLAYFNQLKQSGKRIICIDPVRSESCEFLNAEWVAVRPGTDVAMMLGMAHALLAEKKQDQVFLDKYTVGFDKFMPYLMGEKDGQVKDAAWASAICGVPADQIKQLALDLADKRTMLMSGWGPQRQHHGEQIHWMLVTLASMLGQIGLPGGGFGLSYHYSNGGVPTVKGGIPGSMSSGGSDTIDAAWLEDVGKLSFPLARISDVLQNPGKKIQFNGSELTYPDINFIYWVGGNPFHHHQDINQLLKAWQKPEVVVVQDIYWTATARHADIVLPVTTSYERNDITLTGDYSNMHLVPMKQATEPQHEARSDFDIFSDLAKRFNVADKYTEGKDEMAWLRGFYETAFQQARKNRINLPRFEAFWEKNQPIVFKADEKATAWVRHGDYRKDPLLNPLGTPSGKIEIYSTVIEKMNYDDCPPHPTWMEPAEWLGMKEKPAPLHMMSCHPKYRLHSQLANTSLRGKYAVADREPVRINPADAQARSIANGDIVRVFNARGQVLAGAVVTDGVPAGVVVLSEGAWYDPAQPGEPGTLCKNGCANVLTLDIGTSQLAQGNCAHTALVDIEKYSGEAPKVTAFTPPKGAA